MANNYYQKKSSKKQEDSIEAKIVIGIFKGLWWLITAPFKFMGKKGETKTVVKPGLRESKAIDSQAVATRWTDIQTSIGLGGATHFGSAVVAADKLLDYVLKQKGYAGDTMGERLKSARDDFSQTTYNNVWEAHKLRNQLVHELHGEVLSWQAKEAIGTYEQALREMGVIK
jgi:hypothetical protein